MEMATALFQHCGCDEEPMRARLAPRRPRDHPGPARMAARNRAAHSLYLSSLNADERADASSEDFL
jgi:hypothetical protein